MDFSSKPVLVFWELTKACGLACKHCRASAIKTPLPGELTTKEGFRLLEQVAAFGRPYPVLIFTGGDPLMRNDFPELLAYVKNLGIKFAVSPAVTDILTHEKLVEIRDSGATSVSVSLDGACKETHDGIRSIDGTFEKTLETIKHAISIGLNIQVNTTVMRRNVNELAKIFHLIKSLGIKTWEVFFLIKVGRGTKIEELNSDEYESVCNFLYDASMLGMTVRTVEGPFIRRISITRSKEGRYWNSSLYKDLSTELNALDGKQTLATSTIATHGTLDGDGIIFIAHDGDVYPGGFIPIALGNVKSDNLARIYREDPLLKDIRNRKILGDCGVCEFKNDCGGSRARAYASSDNPLGSDPACIKAKIF